MWNKQQQLDTNNLRINNNNKNCKNKKQQQQY